MAGGDVITKGASKRTDDAVKRSTRAGGDVITKGPQKKANGKTSKSGASQVSARKKRKG